MLDRHSGCTPKTNKEIHMLLITVLTFPALGFTAAALAVRHVMAYERKHHGDI